LTVTLSLEFIENLRKEWIITDKTEIEILNSLRLGTEDYDYKTVRKITEGGQGVIFEIKSNIDGKTYIGKRLKFQIGSNLNESLVQSQAEREITLLKL
jgi:serine/threonine protein kinase